MSSRAGIFALVALAIIAVALTAGCNRHAIAMATTGDYPPFNELDDRGYVQGLEREIGDELCERANLRCSWVINDWDEMIPDLMAMQFDVIIAGMSITNERDELIDFTDPYYPPTPSSYIGRAGEGSEAVSGIVGVFGTGIYADYVVAHDIAHQIFDTSPDTTQALLDGRIDVVLTDHGHAALVVSESGGQLEIVSDGPTLDRGIGLGIRDGSGLGNRFNDALAEMKADGTLNRLIRKWVGEDAVTF